MSAILTTYISQFFPRACAHLRNDGWKKSRPARPPLTRSSASPKSEGAPDGALGRRENSHPQEGLLMSHWFSANVLQSLPGGRRLWRFSGQRKPLILDGEKNALTLQEPAPAAVVGKNWQSLLRPSSTSPGCRPTRCFSGRRNCPAPTPRKSVP